MARSEMDMNVLVSGLLCQRLFAQMRDGHYNCGNQGSSAAGYVPTNEMVMKNWAT